MNKIKIRMNGIGRENMVADWDSKIEGGKGQRQVILSGWSVTEIGARQQLFEQAKAMRNELNEVIEEMIEELCAGVARP